jgi:hypothetical protein
MKCKGNPYFVANVPTIQMKEGFLLSPKVSALIPEDSQGVSYRNFF